MRENDQSALLVALACPFGEKNLDRISKRRFIRSSRGHRSDDVPVVAEQRYVAENVLPILRTHPDQVLAVASGLLSPPGCRAVEISDVRHQLSPLAGQQVHHIHPFPGSFQQGGHGRQEVHMCVGCNPSPVPPWQHSLYLDFNDLSFPGDEQDFSHGSNLVALRYLEIDHSDWQIHPRLSGNIGTGVCTGVDEVGAVVLKPRRVPDTVTVHRRQILAGGPMDVQLHRYRCLASLLHHPHGYSLVR